MSEGIKARKTDRQNDDGDRSVVEQRLHERGRRQAFRCDDEGRSSLVWQIRSSNACGNKVPNLKIVSLFTYVLLCMPSRPRAAWAIISMGIMAWPKKGPPNGRCAVSPCRRHRQRGRGRADKGRPLPPSIPLNDARTEEARRDCDRAKKSFNVPRSLPFGRATATNDGRKEGRKREREGGREGHI